MACALSFCAVVGCLVCTSTTHRKENKKVYKATICICRREECHFGLWHFVEFIFLLCSGSGSSCRLGKMSC